METLEYDKQSKMHINHWIIFASQPMNEDIKAIKSLPHVRPIYANEIQINDGSTKSYPIFVDMRHHPFISE